MCTTRNMFKHMKSEIQTNKKELTMDYHSKDNQSLCNNCFDDNMNEIKNTNYSNLNGKVTNCVQNVMLIKNDFNIRIENLNVDINSDENKCRKSFRRSKKNKMFKLKSYIPYILLSFILCTCNIIQANPIKMLVEEDCDFESESVVPAATTRPIEPVLQSLIGITRMGELAMVKAKLLLDDYSRRILHVSDADTFIKGSREKPNAKLYGIPMKTYGVQLDEAQLSEIEDTETYVTPKYKSMLYNLNIFHEIFHDLSAVGHSAELMDQRASVHAMLHIAILIKGLIKEINYYLKHENDTYTQDEVDDSAYNAIRKNIQNTKIKHDTMAAIFREYFANLEFVLEFTHSLMKIRATNIGVDLEALLLDLNNTK